MTSRIVHQCWVGPKPIPEREAAWCAEMKRMNAGSFDVRLYDNRILETYGQDPYVKDLIDRGQPWAFVSDRIRCLLLRDHGGIWLDCDCQPIRPLNTLDHVWNSDTKFVYGFRSPHRQGVALHRGVSLVDNTFLASAPNSRMANRLLELWTPTAFQVDGHAIGVQILSYSDLDCTALNYRYFYALSPEPESVVLHDAHNLYTWKK